MASTYSWLSLAGLVSSYRRWHTPPGFSSAMPKFSAIAWAWPMCRYPFGSGGNRVTTRPPQRPLALSSAMSFRMKWVPGVGSAVMANGSTGASAPARRWRAGRAQCTDESMSERSEGGGAIPRRRQRRAVARWILAATAAALLGGCAAGSSREVVDLQSYMMCLRTGGQWWPYEQFGGLCLYQAPGFQ